MLQFMWPLSFMGGRPAPKPITPDTYTDTTQSPTDARCYLTVDTTGAWQIGGDNVGILASGNTNTGGGAGIWVRWTSTVGSLSNGGPSGTALQLNANRTFDVVFTALNGTKSCTGTVDFATDAGMTNIIATSSITIAAQVTP